MNVEKILRKFGQVFLEDRSNEISKLSSTELNFRISYYVADENTRKYIREYGLDNPQKLIGYLVESGFARTEIVIDSVNDIKDEIYAELKGELKGIKGNIKRILNRENSKEKFDRLDSYQDELNKIRCRFEEKAMLNIQAVYRIDNMGRFERFARASFIEKNIDAYTRIAKSSLEAVLEVLKIQFFIADYMGDKNSVNSIWEEIEEFMTGQILSRNVISTMNEWALEKDRPFWSDKIRRDYKSIIEQHVGLLEMFDDMREQADLENIIFT